MSVLINKGLSGDDILSKDNGLSIGITVDTCSTKSTIHDAI